MSALLKDALEDFQARDHSGESFFVISRLDVVINCAAERQIALHLGHADIPA